MPPSFAGFRKLSIFYFQRVRTVWPLRWRPEFSGFLACIIKELKTKWVCVSLFTYMNDSKAAAGVWFPHWADVLSKVRLKDLERQAYRHKGVSPDC